MAGYEPTVRIANIAEVRAPEESPEGYVQRLSREKAMAVGLEPDEIVLAADTTVVVRLPGDTLVLEKPSSTEEAASMLRQLSARRHEVLTGFTVRSTGELQTHLARTFVDFYPLAEEEVDWYVASGESADKAGAYAIQGVASRFVRGIEGCYNNVVGLPVAAVHRVLRTPPFCFNP
jgi:septum formation protein